MCMILAAQVNDVDVDGERIGKGQGVLVERCDCLGHQHMDLLPLELKGNTHLQRALGSALPICFKTRLLLMCGAAGEDVHL